MTTSINAKADLGTRIDELDWDEMTAGMNEIGCAQSAPILTPDECAEIVALFDDDSLFRSTIDMGRHRFGNGRYRYFDNPIPAPIAKMRAAFWPRLLPIARDWANKLGRPSLWPDAFDDWLQKCHDA